MNRTDPLSTLPPHRTPVPIAALVIVVLSLLPFACGPTAEDGRGAPATARDAQTATGAPARPAEEVSPVRLDLPERFRALIRSEMVQIEAAMQEELRHLARAEGTEGAAVARQIHESFVMKQQLTPEDREQLRTLLPPDFVALDQGFHQKAAEMADAFDRGDFPAAADLYGELTRACVRCHGRFAAERFAGLADGEEP